MVDGSETIVSVAPDLPGLDRPEGEMINSGLTNHFSLPEPDAEFYMSNVNVVFQVGGTLFRVPRKKFEVSNFPYRDRLSRTSTEEERLVLDIDEVCFRGFLRELYPFNAYQMSIDDWRGALDVATRWDYKEVRKRAIQALDNWVNTQLGAKEAALLAKKYGVGTWLKEAYIRLLQKNPLTIDELVAPPELDWETIGRLFCVKQAASPWTGTSRCPSYPYADHSIASSCPGCLQENMAREFQKEFGDLGVTCSPFRQSLFPSNEISLAAQVGTKKKKKKK